MTVKTLHITPGITHSDHPDFICEVRVKQDSPEPYDGRHALIYTDGYVAVTMYECLYNLFVVASGRCKSDSHLRLTRESIERIRALAAARAALATIREGVA